MLRRYHGIVDLSDLSLRIDQEAEAGRIGFLFLDHPIGHTRNPIRVAQQIIGKIKFFLKRAVFLGFIKRCTENYRIFGCEVLDSITEPLAFNGSARRIGFWIPP